ncbi:serpin B [Streptosporangium becharense]|uniref:Serpin B n=1 Tax=Streptosporangium becharense TaxID=1816182 RepID=A0A7W9IP55_9ACTN|nr:serpin family protein [Streptosporangium becharense]MBB2914339.1 serpin B [Streptosporangium becharense]MBB5823629.1 serpin B [Streptosporangium becharense]
MRRLLTALLTRAARPGTDPNMLVATGVRRKRPVAPPVAETVRGLAAFGHALFAQAAAPEANAVLSPLSIGYAFGMARAGAAAATAVQLDRVFGFPTRGPHTALNALTRRILTTGGSPPRSGRAVRTRPEPPVLAMASGLFTRQGLSVRPGFLHTLAAQYGTGVREVDFTRDAAQIIDAWAARETAGRITKVFDHLAPDTQLVLANAVYFKAGWEWPFTDPPERGAAFTRADGTVVRTDLMRRSGTVPYAAGPGWQAVELRYTGGELVMWVLLPEAGGSPVGLLAPEVMTRVAAELEERQVELALPRWDFSTRLDLLESLSALGLTGTDYSGIAEEIFLEQAIHRAAVTVDERGTEAAAVTALASAPTGPPPPPPKPVRVRADRPFAFAIVHRPTLMPLFIGQVADPVAKG